MILLGFALLGILVYHFAPVSRTVVPVIPAPIFAQEVETFFNLDSGNRSSVTLLSKDSPLSANLFLQSPAGKEAWAGIGWPLHDANWSFMDTFYVEMRADGLKEVQFKILTYDPDHTNPEDRDTYRQVVKEVPVTSDWVKIAVPSEDFYIPDWWYVQQKVSHSLSSKHFERVYRLAVQAETSSPRNVPLKLEIRSLTIVGRNNYYLGFLLVYLFILTLFAIGTHPNPSSKR